jgi:hypothetical protein
MLQELALCSGPPFKPSLQGCAVAAAGNPWGRKREGGDGCGRELPSTKTNWKLCLLSQPLTFTSSGETGVLCHNLCEALWKLKEESQAE